MLETLNEDAKTHAGFPLLVSELCQHHNANVQTGKLLTGLFPYPHPLFPHFEATKRLHRDTHIASLKYDIQFAR